MYRTTLAGEDAITFTSPYSEEFKQKAIDAVLKEGKTRSDVANERGVSERTVRTWVKKAKQAERVDEYVPVGQKLRGVSSLRDKAGNVVMEWVKTCLDTEAKKEALLSLIEAAKKDIKPLPYIPFRAVSLNDDIMTVIPMGDPHLGLRTWAQEVGEDFNIQRAERDLWSAVKHLIDKSPYSKAVALINLGDFFHFDNTEGKTSRSGHVLEVDVPIGVMIDVGYRLMVRMINYSLEKFETVHVINAIGNHDDVTAEALNSMCRVVYEKNPRVQVSEQCRHRHYLQWGKVAIGVTHGHETKDDNLPLIMAADQPELWGSTLHRYFYRGHHHHENKKEYNGCVVEQFRTLAPSDRYAHNFGFLSKQSLEAIYLHKEFGEIGRDKCSIELLRHYYG